MPTYLPIFGGKLAFGEFKPAMGVFLGLMELARFILLFLVWKELAGVCRDREGAHQSQMLMIVHPSLLGGVILIVLLLKLVAKESGPGSGMITLVYIIGFLVEGCYTTLFVFCGIVAGSVRDGIRRLK